MSSMQKYIDILNEGAMMNDSGTYVFEQTNGTSITVRADSEEHARNKLDYVIGSVADEYGVEFSEEPFEVTSSY
jgi:hypothetical protein